MLSNWTGYDLCRFGSMQKEYEANRKKELERERGEEEFLRNWLAKMKVRTGKDQP